MLRVTLATLGLVAAGACGGSAFTQGSGGGADAGMPPVDATAESTSSSGSGSGGGSGGGSGSSSGAGSSSSSGGGSSSGSGGAQHDAGATCDAGSGCASGYCSAGTCAPCTGDSECADHQFCDLLSGVCRPTLGAGQTCIRAVQCTSGFCADGVCCSTACLGTCEACNEPSSPGTCSPVPPGMNNPNRSCPSSEVCCGSNGAGSATTCTNTQNSVDDCGTCGHVCTTSLNPQCTTPVCTSGQCGVDFFAAGTHCGDGGTCNGTGVCL